jgi:hypothetical protein
MSFGPILFEMGVHMRPISHGGMCGAHLADPRRVCSPLVDREHRLNIGIQYIYSTSIMSICSW